LLITGDDIRARLIIEKAKEILLDVFSVRGICFCVSQAHAHLYEILRKSEAYFRLCCVQAEVRMRSAHGSYMADRFNVAGIPAMALTANTARDVRKKAVTRLRQRDVNFLCVVEF